MSAAARRVVARRQAAKKRVVGMRVAGLACLIGVGYLIAYPPADFLTIMMMAIPLTAMAVVFWLPTQA